MLWSVHAIVRCVAPSGWYRDCLLSPQVLALHRGVGSGRLCCLVASLGLQALTSHCIVISPHACLGGDFPSLAFGAFALHAIRLRM